MRCAFRNGILQNDIKTPPMDEEKYGGGWLGLIIFYHAQNKVCMDS